MQHWHSPCHKFARWERRRKKRGGGGEYFPVYYSRCFQHITASCTIHPLLTPHTVLIPLPEYPCVDPTSIDKQQFHRYKYTVVSTQWTQGTQCSVSSISFCPSSLTLSRILATQSVQRRKKSRLSCQDEIRLQELKSLFLHKKIRLYRLHFGNVKQFTSKKNNVWIIFRHSDFTAFCLELINKKHFKRQIIKALPKSWE